MFFYSETILKFVSFIIKCITVNFKQNTLFEIDKIYKVHNGYYIFQLEQYIIIITQQVKLQVPWSKMHQHLQFYIRTVA